MDKKILIAICIILLIIVAVFLYLIFGTDTFNKTSFDIYEGCPKLAYTCQDGTTIFPKGPECLLECPGEEHMTLSQIKEIACTKSGGVVVVASCCTSSADFPNTCAIGACGCSAENSKDTKTCLCPEGTCFDGTSCAAAEAEVVPVEEVPAGEDATETEPVTE